jgi:amino acid transporter
LGFIDFILGRRLANRESAQSKIGAFEGVPAMGLDGLSSSAYGPEAALSVLMPLGAAGLGYIGWVMAPIVALLAVLAASYWQTIRAYPGNGGAFIVSRANLGVNLSLLAAAALMIDYVLNVAVGISAGVAALVSTIPSLQQYTLVLCLAILAVIALANLRGTQESGRLLAIPTWLFTGSFVAIIAIGVYRTIATGGHPGAIVPPPKLPVGTEAVSLWLLLRAFASGCTAMTGVEAVSNGMSAFREPAVKYGHRTLAIIVGILGLLLAGIAWTASAYGIGAMDQTQPGYRSVLSQLAGAVLGQGVVYYIAMASLLCILCLSANTSFVGFPRLCRTVAEEGFLPRPFAIAGRRLVYSVGIIYLAMTAGLLLVVFGGITDRLIPLFAIGAFLGFTLSQAGMVVHWRQSLRSDRSNAHAHRLHLTINSVGAIATGTALVIIVIAKFIEGAWITVIAIPLVILLLKKIRRYYDRLQNRLAEPLPLKLQNAKPPVVVVAVGDWNRLTSKAVSFAFDISPDVIGLHLTQLMGPDSEEHLKKLKQQWETMAAEPARSAGLAAPRLVITAAQYRNIDEPVMKLLEQLERKMPGREIAVLIPEVVKMHWYQHILHTDYAGHLRSQLLRNACARLTVINVPWHFPDASQPERPGITAEKQRTRAERPSQDALR